MTNYDEKYVKDLEKLVEVLQSRFEDNQVVLEKLCATFWEEVKFILPYREATQAFVLRYVSDNSTNSVPAFLQLTVESRDYSTAENAALDIISTPDEIFDNLYGKACYCVWDKSQYIDKVYKDSQIELYRTFHTQALKSSNKIAVGTRRGAGNVLVVPTTMARYLSMIANFTPHVEPNKKIGEKSVTYRRMVPYGTLGRFQICVDTVGPENKAIVMYRGNDKNTDGSLKDKLDGCGAITYNRGIHRWFRPDGYQNYWEVIDIK